MPTYKGTVGAEKASDKEEFIAWLKLQYGQVQAWVIQAALFSPLFRGSGLLDAQKYYDFWVKAGRPAEKIPTAPEVGRQWQPSEPYGPEIPTEMRPGLEAEYPWLSQGQTKEQYYEERPWEIIGVSKEDFMRGQVRQAYGYPPEAELAAEEEETRRQEELQRLQMRQTGQGEMWANWRSQQELKASLWNAQAQRWAKERSEYREEDQWGNPIERGGLGQSEKARIWAAGQREILGQYDPNRDWTRRFEIQNMRNPYAGGPESNIDMAAEDVEKAEEEYKYWHAKANQIRSRYKDPNDPLYIGSATEEGTAEQWYASRVLSVERTAQNKLLEFEGTLAEESEGLAGMYAEGIPTSSGGRAYGEVSSRPPRPWHPKTMPWQTRMYGTERQIWGTQRGEKPKLAPPSGQSWSKLLPSERSQWMSYAEHLGQKPLDLLQQTAQMLPKEPSFKGTWAPARQRA